MGCVISNPTTLEKYAGETLVYQPGVSNKTTSIYIGKKTLWKLCKGKHEVVCQTFMNNYRVKRLSQKVPMIVVPQKILKISKTEIAISMNHYPGDLFSLTLAPFDFKRVLKGFEDVVKAIDFLHSKGLAHRDIKPENIVVDQHFFRLIDFDFTSPLTNFIHCGTKNYIYPDENDWSARDRSTRYDIYALGRTILYVYYCAALLEMIDHISLMKKLFINNVVITDVENPFTSNSEVKHWFDVALKCCSEVPHLTVPTTDDTIASLQMVDADDIVA